ncbi:unnamed protein product [Peniophora sp. CBMAI 1063]|nr:unnamed protein product [Peniophora sp. CBMAI 1063]
MPALRTRLRRSAKDIVFSGYSDAWFPDVPSDDPVHKRIAKLNVESYPFDLMSYADDVVMRTLFGSKRPVLSWNSVVPESSSRDSRLQCPNILQDLRAAFSICRFLTNSEVEGSLEDAVSGAVNELVAIPTFYREDPRWKDVLTQ